MLTDDEMPPLPEPVAHPWLRNPEDPQFTSAQMLAYGRAAESAILERLVQVAYADRVNLDYKNANVPIVAWREPGNANGRVFDVPLYVKPRDIDSEVK